MDQHQQQNNRRRAVEAGAGAVNHPPPQPCPRCNSSNTKFCYYNNYSLSQPRYFCKGCRRYWTHGGTLRNVPVGGGCRKSKRPKLSSPSPTSVATSRQLPLLQPPPQLPSPQLIINAQDHHQLSMFSTNSGSNNNNISVNSGGNNVAATMMSPSFLGGGNPGFLSSLAAMQGGSQPLNFGPNLGLLQGFTLPNFEHHRQPPQPLSHQQQQHQEETFESMYSAREVGSTSATATAGMENWSLGMQPGPPAPNTNNNRNNGNSQNNQWPNFVGTSGLDDP